jgi:hypothetical protein
MSKYKAAIPAVALAALGAVIGVILAQWISDDPEVRLAGRLLLGWFGAVIGWFVAKWFIIEPKIVHRTEARQ